MKKVLNNKVTKLGEKKELILNEDISKSEKMRSLFDLGYSIKQIADFMKVRYNFVYNVINIHILQSHCEVESSKGKSKKDDVIALLNNGFKVKAIADEVKVNINYVYKIKKEFESAKLNAKIKEVREAKEVAK